MIGFWRKTIVFFFTTILLIILLISHETVPIAEAQSSTPTAARPFSTIAYPNRSLSAFPAQLAP
ncbi:MAG: superoxide dismutase, partial [Nostoc sp. NMS4]|nr:superoxide dismutase [Nostoc sp. NMS4]